MGFQIDCPNCGPRTYTEFWYGGELVEDVDTADLELSYERVWERANVAGLQRERWFHFGGCRRWLTVERNTATNAVETEPG
jgi:heterotetrameric sarcosine oxidase delta subunit